MSHPIPEDAQRLATRLRQLADEVESAARYGVPIPISISADGLEFGAVDFAVAPVEFDAWVEYAEAEVTQEYDRGGKHWRIAGADVNGLPLRFCTRQPIEQPSEVPA